MHAVTPQPEQRKWGGVVDGQPPSMPNQSKIPTRTLSESSRCKADRPPRNNLPYCPPHPADFLHRHPKAIPLNLLYRKTMPWTTSIMPWNTSSHAIAPQRQNDEPSLPTGGRTTYLSTNNQDRSTFLADAPAGSKHAARLSKIALENQAGYARTDAATVPKKRVKGKSRQRLTLYENPVQQQQRQPQGPPSSSLITSRGQSGGGYTDDERQCYCSSCTDNNNNNNTSPVHHHHHHQNNHHLTSPAAAAPSSTAASTNTIHRYQSPSHVTYHRKSPAGELMISAPHGSREAESMDNAASRYRVR